jgi:hypothetical protein
VPPAGPFSVINNHVEKRPTREVGNDVADKCDNLDNTSFKMIYSDNSRSSYMDNSAK